MRDAGRRQKRDGIGAMPVLTRPPRHPLSGPGVRALPAGSSFKAPLLPVPLTPLIGREGHLARTAQLLAEHHARLITLTGPGGVGKTHLALALAVTLLALFPGGIWFLDLISITEPPGLLPALARALDFPVRAPRRLLATLQEQLQDRRLLVVLDNFEHLVDAGPVLTSLLVACPGLSVLVTSRVPLDVRGEQVIPVPPLGLPDPAAHADPASLADVPAVALFLARARSVAPDFALTSDNAGAVATLCRRLDGLPLAIELAAAHSDIQSPQSLLTRLARTQDLGAPPRDLPARQRSLTATLDWSYQLLTAAEQTLFRRLAVFTGTASLEAVGAVAGELPNDADPLATSTTLIRHNLALLSGTAGNEPRVRLLETVRAYAWERLAADSVDLAATQRRHATYYLTLAEAASPRLLGPDAPACLAQLAQAYDHLRAALGWAFAHNASLALRLTGALWRFWFLRGDFSEGRRALETALDRSTMGDPARVPALAGAGVLAYQQGDYEAAVALLEEVMPLARKQDRAADLTLALNVLGLALQRRGEYARASVLHEEALALARKRGDRWSAFFGLNNLALLARRLGDDERAARDGAASLALARELGSPWSIHLVLDNLGLVALRQGDPHRAEALFAESLELSRQLGDQQGRGFSLNNLALVAHARGDNATAARLAGESLALASEIESRELLLESLELVALLAPAETAARFLGAAEALREANGYVRIPASRAGHLRLTRDLEVALGTKALAAVKAAGRALAPTGATREALAATAVLADTPRAAAGTPIAAPAAAARPAVALTRRERDIARLIARGLTNREIAARLNIGARTVETHAANLQAKLGVAGRAEAAAWAARELDSPGE